MVAAKIVATVLFFLAGALLMLVGFGCAKTDTSQTVVYIALGSVLVFLAYGLWAFPVY